MSQNLKLYHYWRSSCSWRVRWALCYKNVPYQEETVNLLNNEQNQPTYLNSNPSGTVPYIATSQFKLSESLAIIEWLEETYPKKPLLPNNSKDKALVREYVGIIQSTQSVQNLRVMKRHSKMPSEQILWAKEAITQGLYAFEKRLQATAGTYSMGGSLTMADLFLVPQIYNAHRFKVDMNQFPICERIYQTCLQRKDCDRSAPHRQAGAHSQP